MRSAQDIFLQDLINEGRALHREDVEAIDIYCKKIYKMFDGMTDAQINRIYYSPDELEIAIGKLEMRRLGMLPHTNAPNGGVSVTQINSTVLNVSIEQVFESVSNSKLSDADKTMLTGMLTEIQQLRKKDKDKMCTKMQSLFKWIADKTMDVTLATTLVPFLASMFGG